MPTIVVIEDSQADIMLLEQAFKEAAVDCRIRSISDGAEARDYIQTLSSHSQRPDLLLLDMNIPKIDGLALLAEVRHSADLRDIPVVVWSSTRGPRESAAASKLGVTDFVVKPVTLAGWTELACRLSDLARGRSASAGA